MRGIDPGVFQGSRYVLLQSDQSSKGRPNRRNQRPRNPTVLVVDDQPMVAGHYSGSSEQAPERLWLAEDLFTRVRMTEN